MISLITTCDPQRFYLLPWFVKHYRACGVERFYINLHFDFIYPPEVQPDLVGRGTAILRDLDLRVQSNQGKGGCPGQRDHCRLVRVPWGTPVSGFGREYLA